MANTPFNRKRFDGVRRALLQPDRWTTTMSTACFTGRNGTQVVELAAAPMSARGRATAGMRAALKMGVMNDIHRTRRK